MQILLCSKREKIIRKLKVLIHVISQKTFFLQLVKRLLSVFKCKWCLLPIRLPSRYSTTYYYYYRSTHSDISFKYTPAITISDINLLICIENTEEHLNRVIRIWTWRMDCLYVCVSIIVALYISYMLCLSAVSNCVCYWIFFVCWIMLIKLLNAISIADSSICSC